jgi:hypothetical protein
MKSKARKGGSKKGMSVIPLPRGIHSREVGKFTSKMIGGEEVYEAEFICPFTAVGAATAAATSITPANLVTALSTTVFAKFYTGSSTGAFARCRFVGVGLTVAPIPTATPSTAGAYALIPGLSAGTLPSSIYDVLNEVSSMLYVPPTVTSGATTGSEVSSKPSKSLSLLFSGTDAVWLDPGSIPSTTLATLLFYSGTGAVTTSTVILSVRAQFKGFGAQ